MHALVRVFSSLICIVLYEVASTPEILTSEYRLRRNKLMLSVANATKDIGSKKYVAVIAANPVYYMAPDVPYPYRQNSDFLYLTGFQEPDAVLVLESTDLTCYKSILFVREKNPQQELWDGPRCGVENVSELFGIDEGCSINKLPEYLSAWHNCTFWVNNLSTKIQNLLHSFRREYFDLSSFIHSLRIIKSSSEIDLMKLSAITASRAMAETMKASNAGISEAFLHAYFEFECRKNGADALAYPPVVAGGRRANILHYTKNSQLIVDDELVLVDAGCDYRCYSSDISRTWPINGRFNRAQRQLYEAILDVQETCIKACKPGISLNDLYVIMQKQLESNVVGVGIFKDSSLNREKIRLICNNLCPHHVGHYLGMDVHDTTSISTTKQLEEHMVITVEPGIYIPHDADYIHTEFRGIGIRIEDNLLITPNNHEVITSMCPKTVNAIEETMSNQS